MSRTSLPIPFLFALAIVAIDAPAVTRAASAPSAIPALVWERAARTGEVAVVVGLRTADSGGTGGEAAARTAGTSVVSVRARLGKVLAGRPHRVRRTFDSIPFAAIETDAAGLLALESSPEVSSVRLDEAARLDLVESAPLVGSPGAWTNGWDGSGEVVAVVDSGVETGHPFLAGATVAEACFSAAGNCPGGATTLFGPGAGGRCALLPTCGHGTHVAGIAVGRGPTLSPPRFGIARGAGLVAVQAASILSGGDCEGDPSPCVRLYQSDILAALEWILGLSASRRIAAVNLSLGAGSYSSQAECDEAQPAYRAMIDRLSAAGIATVASSSNRGTKAAMSAPACVSSAVSVGATTKTDEVAVFSNSAAFLSLLAPGAGILSSWPGGGFTTVSGTSMAAPHVSGAWAVLRQASPGADVERVRAVLRATGRPVTDLVNGLTTPRIRVDEAVDALLRTTDCVRGPRNFCLQRGRFRVEATWTNPLDGAGGAAGASDGETNDSGLFWFYGPANLEILVKVLDGCAQNGRYWVFAAAATTLEFRLVVTDTTTGATRTWFHPFGSPAPAITDVEAFATCP